MINLELIRNVIKNPSFYGVALAFVGAAGIFGYSIYNNMSIFTEKENGDQFITIQLSAFAPPSKDPIAEKVEQPKAHKPRKHKPKPEQIQAPPKPVPTPLQAMEEPQTKIVEETSETTKEVLQETQAKEATTIAKPDNEALAQENVKIMRYSDGDDNEFLRAIHRAVEKRHVYPPLALQRGYEGEVLVKFYMDVSGKVSRFEIVRNSPHSLLDKAAIRTLKRACKHFPKPLENVYVEIPIVYKRG
ncbi:MAG: energy transducer TonB [Helicobacter trogontum]|uniref:energy transducer TonB n=1 Tax=Helicobacter trogontum TaxID=50960 RepID=UPI0024320818|nr:energy transducer TonB [Helicobacter trogontum]MCI5786655.1 energy transducer TonB [Helicobacter trogontum]